MSSQDQTITFKAIAERAESDAREYMPALPKENTLDAWESYQADVESLDAFEIAHESCEWDWVIYYGRAMELCQSVPGDVLSDAESEWHDMGAPVGETFGLYELACELAAIIVTREIASAVESVKDELIEMAENEMDKF
jgi:hypothetical protein